MSETQQHSNQSANHGRAPRVSIGMPVYNGGPLVIAAVESVLQQTYGDFELIISDNVSDDGTEHQLAEFARQDPRVRYVRNEKNVGAIPNFNQCVDLARGELFKWQAADDLVQPKFLEYTVAALDENPDAVLAHTRTRVIDAEDRMVADSPNPFRKWDSPKRMARWSSALRDLFCYEIYGLMRLDALRRSTRHANFRGGDKTLLAELSLMGRFVRVEKSLFLRRVHPAMSGAQDGKTKRTHSGWTATTPYRLKAFGFYFKLLHRHPLSLGERLRGYAEVMRMSVAYHRWYKLLVPGPSNYFGFAGFGKPDAGTAGEGGMLVQLEKRRAAVEATRRAPTANTSKSTPTAASSPSGSGAAA